MRNALTMANEVRIRRVSQDDERQRVREFFGAHIPGSTAFPLPNRQVDAALGTPSQIWVAEDSPGDLIGALFASNNPFDVVAWRQQGQEQVAAVIANEMAMIHELAVARHAQRSGIGSRLARAAIDNAQASGAAIATLIYDQRTPGLNDFYENLGFRVLAPGELLKLHFAALRGTPVGFPQSDRSFRWAAMVLNSARCRIAE